MMEPQRSTYEVTATRKRPQDFDRLVGQDFVVSTLENAIKENRIAHAYLFSGPRGVGKTSSARLLAKSLNCQQGMSAHPCGVCDSCREIAKGSSVDVIEIDGASNTSVNDIRAIKEEIMFPPQSSRYKIYIIDEVHMLSTSAFNALLKTIEEPPEYIIFIFATTELQKVPLTIRSRCQQFRFKLISQDLIMECLRSASDDIGIKADEDALFWIAKEATGSMRDAYTLFDQVAAFSGDHITLAKIREKLAIAGFSAIAGIVGDATEGRQADAIARLGELFSQGVSAEGIVKDTADFFHALLLYKEGIRKPEILGSALEDIPVHIAEMLTREQLEAALKAFLTLYRELRFSLSPRFEIELLFSRLGSLPYLSTPDVLVKKLEALKEGIADGSIVIKKAASKVIVEQGPASPAVPAADVTPQAAAISQPEGMAAQEAQPITAGKPEPAPAPTARPLRKEDLKDISAALTSAKKAVLAKLIMDIESIEEDESGTLFLSLSKALSFNSLKLQQKDAEKAIASYLGHPVQIRFRLIEEKKEEEDIPDGMKKLRSIFGGTVAKTSAAAAAAAETEEETAEEEEGYAQSIQSGYDENEDDE